MKQNSVSKYKKCTLRELIDEIETGKRPKGGVKDIKQGIPSISGEHFGYDGKFNNNSENMDFELTVNDTDRFSGIVDFKQFSQNVGLAECAKRLNSPAPLPGVRNLTANSLVKFPNSPNFQIR